MAELTHDEMVDKIAKLSENNRVLTAKTKDLINEVDLWRARCANADGAIKKLSRENEIITGMCNSSSKRFNKLYHLLQEIKAIMERELSLTEDGDELYDVFSEIIQKIAKVESGDNQ